MCFFLKKRKKQAAKIIDKMKKKDLTHKNNNLKTFPYYR